MIASAQAAKKITRASSGSSWLGLGETAPNLPNVESSFPMLEQNHDFSLRLCFPPSLNTFVFHPRSHVMDCPGHGPAAGQMSQLMHLSSLCRATIPLTASAKPLPAKVRLPTKQYRREARGCDFGLDVCQRLSPGHMGGMRLWSRIIRAFPFCSSREGNSRIVLEKSFDSVHRARIFYEEPP